MNEENVNPNIMDVIIFSLSMTEEEVKVLPYQHVLLPPKIFLDGHEFSCNRRNPEKAEGHTGYYRCSYRTKGCKATVNVTVIGENEVKVRKNSELRFLMYWSMERVVSKRWSQS